MKIYLLKWEVHVKYVLNLIFKSNIRANVFFLRKWLVHERK